MDSVFFHIDVNSAFLSWTALERLAQGNATDLREIPSIIGGDMEKRHGVVLAKSIPAKKYGIRTGEPIVNAFRKCPRLIMASPDHTLYRRYSHMLMDYLTEISPDIEQVSIDECYMDYTPISLNYSSPVECARMIRENVHRKFGFTVNVGISDRKVLAKMASDFKKPDMTHTLFASEIEKKLWPLPISALFMCGHSSVETLHKLEILTIGDLAKADLSIIEAHLKSHGKLLWEYANGIDSSTVFSEPTKCKGIGNSVTLPKDVVTTEQAKEILLNLSESVGRRLRAESVRALMVSVEIKYADFTTISHQTTLQTSTDSDTILYQTACRLFEECWNHNPVRLLGVRTSKLSEACDPIQLSIFDLQSASQSERQNKLDNAIDSIRQRFGNNAIVRGSLLKKEDRPNTH